MRKLFLITLLGLYGCTLLAQKESKIFYGISASADFGRFQDRIELTPLAGIKVLPKVYAGLGTTVSFYSTENTVHVYNNNNSRKYKVDDNIWYYGGELFLRFQPFEKQKSFTKNIFLQSSYEYLQGKGKYKDQSGKYRYQTNNHTFLAGLGYKHPLSDKLNLGMSLNFKLNNESDSPYRNPIIRISLEL